MTMHAPPSFADLDLFRMEIIRTCRHIAPVDSSDRPLYLVWGSEILDGTDGTDGTDGDQLYGCTIHSLDLIAQPKIAAWRGRGPAFMVNDRAIFNDTSSSTTNRTQARRWFMETCCAVAVHEFSHVLQNGTHRGEGPSHQLLQAVRRAFKDAIRPSVARDTLPPDIHHEADWLRVALHAAWRWERVNGRRLCHETLTGCNDRGLSCASTYIDALGDEPRQMVGESFAFIKAMPPPEAFTRLWHHDTARIEKTIAA